jgi:hypothetical protein
MDVTETTALSAFVPTIDFPCLGLILLAGTSLLILLISGLRFATLKRSITLICALPFLLLLPANAATPIPLSIALRFGSDKHVEFPVALTKHRFYQVDLVFPFDSAEQRLAARKLAGEPTRDCKITNECGVTPSFLVTIRNGDGVVLSEAKTPVGHYAFSSSGFYRAIVKIRLKPALYEIRVEVTHSPSELANYGALIQFTTDSRSADLED